MSEIANQDASKTSLYGGIEAGGTKFVCAVGTGPDDIRARTQFPTTSPEETLGKAVAEAIRALYADRGRLPHHRRGAQRAAGYAGAGRVRHPPDPEAPDRVGSGGPSPRSPGGRDRRRRATSRPSRLTGTYPPGSISRVSTSSVP